ncbi:hypothetical protein CO656_21185 [Sinorhizobium sp. FG01]|uniref:Uncharacterized protein n=1 Tax=Sinorhizobium americanum TaxID=194963 RepID=A0A2S3YVH9_9HYPH|nr:hypothetical protein CO656_21185 [Sinorhizobium sp. FG01]POH35640.1 hypothetical protein ATY31_02210 [Sinorhizobium americanum]
MFQGINRLFAAAFVRRRKWTSGVAVVCSRVRFRGLSAIVAGLMLVGCGPQSSEQPITVKSPVSNLALVIPRGYFLVPPPKDGLLSKATAHAFITDYPNFNYKSPANLQAFREIGSLNVVQFVVRFGPSMSIDALFRHKLNWYGKERDRLKDPTTGLSTFRTRRDATSPFKNNSVFYSETPDKVFIECGPVRPNQHARCEMSFSWEGLVVTADFNRNKLGEWRTIKDKINSKLNCWHQRAIKFRETTC